MPAFDTLNLDTGRLLLRPLEPDDAGALFAIFSDLDVMRYLSTPPWPSIETAHDLIAKDRIEMAAGEHIRLGIENRRDSALLGTCSLFHLSAQCRRAEVGYALARSAWGHGHVQEAVSALLDYGFDSLDLNRVEADIDPRNHASAKSLERLGFMKEGLLRQRWIVAGEVSDSSMYGLLREEWMARRAGARNPYLTTHCREE